MIGKLNSALDPVASIVHDVLTFSRPDQNFDETINLHIAIEESVHSCGLLFKNEDIKFEMDLKSVEPILDRTMAKFKAF